MSLAKYYSTADINERKKWVNNVIKSTKKWKTTLYEFPAGVQLTNIPFSKDHVDSGLIMKRPSLISEKDAWATEEARVAWETVHGEASPADVCEENSNIVRPDEFYLMHVVNKVFHIAIKKKAKDLSDEPTPRKKKTDAAESAKQSKKLIKELKQLKKAGKVNMDES